MPQGTETFEVLKALKIHWTNVGLLANIPGGAHTGEIQGRRTRPYLAIVPLGEADEMGTNKGNYDMAGVEIGLVHDTFELAGGPLSKLVKDNTEDAALPMDAGTRLLKFRRTDRRYEEIENYWVYWQTFEALVAT